MKIKLIYSVTVLLMIYQSCLYGQVTDSIPEKKENKTTDIVLIAIPSAMITYGLISLGDNGIRQIDYDVRNSLEKNNRFWTMKSDSYLQFAPAAIAYSLKLGKVKSAHNLLDMTIIYGLSNALAGGVVNLAKVGIGRERPDGSNNLSFPSGHTQTAFVAAEFLYQEYKDKSIWIGVGGYSIATFVGISRIYKDRHWVSDVITGAGVGILSTKAIYFIYPYLQKQFGKKGQPLNAVILPGYSDGNVNLAFSYSF